MMATIRSSIKENSTLSEFVKEITIFDAILNTKVAWEAVKPDTIIKCFKRCGVHAKMEDAPVPVPVVDNEFAREFQALLEIPWEEYLQMEDEMEQQVECSAPDGKTYDDKNDDKRKI